MCTHALRRMVGMAVGVAAAVSALAAGVAHAQQPRPNILVISGDDIGVHNVSAYTHAIMGYRTPNIDRIAREGRSSPTPTPSRAARPGARRSSWASIRSARAS